MATIYSKLINHYKFKYHMLFSAIGLMKKIKEVMKMNYSIV